MPKSPDLTFRTPSRCARYTLILEMPRAFAIAVGPLSLRTKRLNRISADHRLAALVDPCSLRLRNTLQLSLAPQSGLELGKHSRHAQEAFPRCSAGIDGLARRVATFGFGLRTMSWRSPIDRPAA